MLQTYVDFTLWTIFWKFKREREFPSSDISFFNKEYSRQLNLTYWNAENFIPGMCTEALSALRYRIWGRIKRF